MSGDLGDVELAPVHAANWRAVAAVEVHPSQQAFVATTVHYLALCAYGGDWHPLAVVREGQVVGFLMWAYDTGEDAHWLGGIVIDRAHQAQGIGRAAVRAAIDLLAAEGHRSFALSYRPENATARGLYRSLGFVETGERDDDELVARLELSGPNAAR